MSYFEKEENAAQLLKVCESWQGAPYRHMGQSRGGVDCTKLIALLLVELGILSKLEEDYYSQDWQQHSDKEVLLTAFLRHLNLYIAPGIKCQILRFRPGKDMYKNGDIITFCDNSRGLINHCGIICNNKLFHANYGSPAGFTFLAPKMEEKARLIFRLEA